MLARASYYKHVSLGPHDLDRSLGRHVRPYTETRQPIRPKDPAVPRGGGCYKAYPGLGNRSIFYPGSSVGSTITLAEHCRTKEHGHSRDREHRRCRGSRYSSAVHSSGLAGAVGLIFVHRFVLSMLRCKFFTIYLLGNKWPSRPHGDRATKSQVCFQDKVGGYILIKCW